MWRGIRKATDYDKNILFSFIINGTIFSSERTLNREVPIWSQREEGSQGSLYVHQMFHLGTHHSSSRGHWLVKKRSLPSSASGTHIYREHSVLNRKSFLMVVAWLIFPEAHGGKRKLWVRNPLKRAGQWGLMQGWMGSLTNPGTQVQPGFLKTLWQLRTSP